MKTELIPFANLLTARITAVVCSAALSCFCLLSPVLAAPGSWTQEADMPLPTSTPAACVVDEILYVIGGHYPYTTAVRQVFAYDPRTDSWTSKAEMPTARRFLAGAAVDGIIYAIGGGADFFHPYATVEAYDPKTDQWSRKCDLPKPLRWLTASAAGGLVYVFVGTETYAYGYTFAYDPQADRWTPKAEFSPRSAGLMSSTVGGIVYLFGGGRADFLGHDFTLAYDPDRDRFTSRRKMPRTRMTAACGAIDGRIYLAGGVSRDPAVYPDAAYYRILDVFDPQGGVTPQILSATLETTNRLRLVWQAEAGIKYGVESSPEVATNRWTRVTLPSGSTVTATNGEVETSCPVVPAEPARFYRVLEGN